MNRYIIAYDDGSSSYLAHALFGKGRGVRQNHKYILKIGEGQKARYFYTPEEVAADKRELQGVAKKTVQPVIQKASNTAQKMRTEFSKKQVERAEAKANKNPWITYKDSTGTYTNGEALKQTAGTVGKVAGAVIKAKNQDKIDKVKDVAERVTDPIKGQAWRVGNALGVGSKENLERSKRYLEEDRAAAKNYEKEHGVKNEELEERVKSAELGVKAAEDYRNRTVAGKAENAKNAVKDTVKDAKSKTYRMKEEFRNKAEKAKDTVKDKIGYDERDRLNNAKKDKEKADKRLDRELKDEVSEEMLARYALGQKFNEIHEGRGLSS